MNWQPVTGTVVRGHRVASGLNGDPRFPGGTLRMQLPHFAARGLDLSAMHLATLNVSIAPRQFQLLRPRHTFNLVQWHPTEPAETFSFINARLGVEGRDDEPAEGWVYHPHLETKPEHFQSPDVLELLMPFIPDLQYGCEVTISVPEEQLVIR